MSGLFYLLTPEVAGGLGPNTQMDVRTVPPTITSLHYVFEGWLGDDLVESYPAFLITDPLGDSLRRAELSGFDLADVQVETSSTFNELYPSRRLPRFRWLQTAGAAGSSDIGADSDGHLVVSERALAVLQTGRLDHCGVEVFG